MGLAMDWTQQNTGQQMDNTSRNKSAAQRKTRVQMWILAYKINGTQPKILIYMKFKLTE